MKSLPGYFRLKLVSNELTPNVNVLSELAGSTENEFLFIGEKLLDFHQRASAIAAMTTDAVGKISGREMGTVIENFESALEMAASLTGGFAAQKDILKSMLAIISQIRSPLVGFEKIVRNLNILCNFIKIETAGLGRSDTGFNALADDVRRIAADIGTKTANLIIETDFLSSLLADNLHLIESMGAKNEAQAKNVLRNIAENIRMLTEKTNLSADAMKDVEKTWKIISANMAEIVESMQFHDITRQRLEHARDALKELPEKISNNRKAGSVRHRLYLLLQKKSAGDGKVKKNKYEEVDLIADTCDLQTDQLRGSRDDFVAAVGRILESLNKIAGHAGSMSAEISEITGSANDTKDSFIMELDRDIGYLDGSINECMHLNEDLAAAMHKVAQKASGMSVFMKAMEKLSIEMQMLALNARVHSAHIGDQGLTLGVLADSINRLAVETTTQVGVVSLHLKDVLSIAGELAAKADSEHLNVQDKAGKIKDNLTLIIEPIKRIDGELKQLLPRIDQAGEMLASDIRQLTTGVTIHNRIDENLENVIACLNGISTKVRPVKTESRRRDDLLEDLAKRYTMDTERAAHLKIANIAIAETASQIEPPVAGMPEEAPAASSSPGKEDDLGDNVDLF